MSLRFVLGRENVPCVAEVVNRSLKADCTDFTLLDKNILKFSSSVMRGGRGPNILHDIEWKFSSF